MAPWGCVLLGPLHASFGGLLLSSGRACRAWLLHPIAGGKKGEWSFDKRHLTGPIVRNYPEPPPAVGNEMVRARRRVQAHLCRPTSVYWAGAGTRCGPCSFFWLWHLSTRPPAFADAPAPPAAAGAAPHPGLQRGHQQDPRLGQLPADGAGGGALGRDAVDVGCVTAGARQLLAAPRQAGRQICS